MLSHEAQELVLYIENDGDLYRQQNVPILRNLANKAAQGKYDHQKAIKLWMYLMDNGAKKYAKEFGGTWNTMFPVAARKEAAKVFADDFEANWKAGEYRSYLTKTSAKKLGGSSRPVPSGGGVAGRNRAGASKAYNVMLNGKKIDTVFATGYTADEMRQSLINHDGYDPRIVVTVMRKRLGSSDTSGPRNRSGSTKPKWGSDRDRYHGNPNARRNRSGPTAGVRTWADGHGRWHAEVHSNMIESASRSVARKAITSEIKARNPSDVVRGVVLISENGHKRIYAET